MRNGRSGIWPLNTSGRTALQIIRDAEASWLKPHLIRPDIHIEICQCEECIQNKLDAIISRMEAA